MCNFVGCFCFARGNLVHGEAGGAISHPIGFEVNGFLQITVDCFSIPII